ncbi:alpha/beta-hydrolases superfamily protein [Anaeramoeba flamelloides]|uniref:Alpha/beta-hydrolases superfamily protein n=1 Tax=Anaeramoeba flamelloides TaxID=1746091 RepID=A0AAV8AHQ6_9EUKA|nr:alpha/beta-hydrolases superfamily protein [Anaeramoeba flamelloides]
MGVIISKIVFRPPKTPPLLKGDNLFFTTTSNKHSVPILKYTPEDEMDEEFKMVKHLGYTSSDNEDSGFGSFSNDVWSLTSQEEEQKKKTKKKKNILIDPQEEEEEEKEKEKSDSCLTSDISNSEQSTSKKKKKKNKKVLKGGKQKKKTTNSEETKQNEKGPIVNRKTLTILFAHGNGECIYELKRFAIRIANRTNCDVYLFEYPGYPQAQGKRREKNCYRSAEAVYHWVINEKKVPAEDIIWFGHSLGTAVALEIASKYPCRGVLLMSPILSIFRVVIKLICNVPLDIFVNLKKAPKMDKPVMILHGTDDVIVPVKHGKKLYELFPNRFDGVWIKHAGHNNIESRFREKFYFEFNRFIDYLITKDEKEIKREEEKDFEEINEKLIRENKLLELKKESENTNESRKEKKKKKKKKNNKIKKKKKKNNKKKSKNQRNNKKGERRESNGKNGERKKVKKNKGKQKIHYSNSNQYSDFTSNSESESTIPTFSDNSSSNIISNSKTNSNFDENYNSSLIQSSNLSDVPISNSLSIIKSKSSNEDLSNNDINSNSFVEVNSDSKSSQQFHSNSNSNSSNNNK